MADIDHDEIDARLHALKNRFTTDRHEGLQNSKRSSLSEDVAPCIASRGLIPLAYIDVAVARGKSTHLVIYLGRYGHYDHPHYSTWHPFMCNVQDVPNPIHPYLYLPSYPHYMRINIPCVHASIPTAGCTTARYPGCNNGLLAVTIATPSSMQCLGNSPRDLEGDHL
jgi:hypothetical protein